MRRLAPSNSRPKWIAGERYAAVGVDLRAAAAEFLQRFAPWTHFVTVTYREDRTPYALGLDVRSLVRELAGELREHVPVAFAWGHQRNGLLHGHLLLAWPPGAPWAPERRLRHGWWALSGSHVQCLPFDPRRPAGDYLAGHDGWEVNVACPRLPRCRRGPGCREARVPW